jgi:phosphoenolpyruvate carboxylase
MAQFEVYTTATVKQGMRYRVAAATAQEAVRKVREGDLAPDDQISTTEEECISEAVEWVWDEHGADVTPSAQQAEEPPE